MYNHVYCICVFHISNDHVYNMSLGIFHPLLEMGRLETCRVIRRLGAYVIHNLRHSLMPHNCRGTANKVRNINQYIIYVSYIYIYRSLGNSKICSGNLFLFCQKTWLKNECFQILEMICHRLVSQTGPAFHVQFWAFEFHVPWHHISRTPTNGFKASRIASPRYL